MNFNAKRKRKSKKNKDFTITHEEICSHVQDFLKSGGKITKDEIPDKINNKIINPVESVDNFLMEIS